MRDSKIRLALLISGGGTTTEAIVNACRHGRLEGVVPACVIASRSDAYGLVRARAAGVSTKDVVVCERRAYATREAFGEALIRVLRPRRIDLVGQYGWLPMTPESVIDAYAGRMINQHPGPLDPGQPDFGGKGMYGIRVHAARLSFVKKTDVDFWTEVTAQRVAPAVDEGAVLRTIRIVIYEKDTPESLQARALPYEHELQIRTLQDFANERVHEVVRETPLIRLEHVSHLEEAKREAIRQYPNENG